MWVAMPLCILRCCKPKLDQKCRSYVTLKHPRILNIQFASFFRGLKVAFLQNQVLLMASGDGPRLSAGVLVKKESKFMTGNYKSADKFLVLPQ